MDTYTNGGNFDPEDFPEGPEIPATPYYGAMTLGEKLLDLTTEYQQSVRNRSEDYAYLPGKAVGREPSVIGAEYETVLRELLVGSASA